GDAHRRHGMRVGRRRTYAALAGDIESPVAPQRLHGELGVIAHGDVGQIGPGALVTVLAPLDVVPSVLNAREVIGIGNRLGILVADDNAVSVEDSVAEAVADYVDGIHSATAGAQHRPARVEEWYERVLHTSWIAVTVDAGGLRVITAVDRLPGADSRGRRQDDVRRARVVAEMRGGAYGLGSERVIRQVLRQAQCHDVAGHGRRIGPYPLELLARIGDVVASAHRSTAGRPHRYVVAVLVLNGGPGRTAEIVQERSHIVLQLLARIGAPVGVGGGEPIRPIGSPEDQVGSRHGFHAYRAGTRIAAVIDEGICQRRRARRVGLAGRPEEVLWVAQ